MDARLGSGRGRRLKGGKINKIPRDFRLNLGRGEISKTVEVVEVRDSEKPPPFQHYHSRSDRFEAQGKRKTPRDEKKLSEDQHDHGFKRSRRDSNKERQTNKFMSRSSIMDNTNRGQETSEKTNRSTSPVSKLSASIQRRNKTHRGQETSEETDRRPVFPGGSNPKEKLDENYLEKCPITEKVDLASIILRTICDVFDGRTDLKRLQQRLASDGVIRFGSTRPLHKFLNEYKNVFQLEDPEIGEDTEEGELEESHVEDTIMVAGKPKLQLCITHSTKAGSCTEECRSLHICKYFILSQCKVEERTGKKCLFGHDMDSEHNKNVMRRALIHLIPPEILRRLKYRNSTTVPVLCNYYNTQRGCNKTECTFLHICRNHVLGRCRSGHCNLTHDINNHQAYDLLYRYGMAPEDGSREQEVIEILGKIESGTTTDTKFPSSTKRPSTKESKEAPTAGRVEDSTLDPDLMENIADSSPWDWGWDWKAEDGKWRNVGDNLKFEEQFREYIQAQKMTFSINNKPSEINFATMKGRINGESPLIFRRVKRE